MHKSALTFGLLASSLVMLVIMPFLNHNNSFLSNPVMAQGYDKYGDSSYSQIPTDDKKYECRTGPFEGFFVSSVEFCKHVKFDNDKHDDRKDYSNRDNNNNKTGTQGPQGLPGPQGPQGPQGLPGVNGTNGINGTNGVNGTNIEPCVACLLDALVKLDSGAVLVNVTTNLERGILGPSGDLNITLPLEIDVDSATLLQAQLGETLGIGENATIFEICAAIDAEGLDITAVINALELDLDPIVTFQISQIVNQIAIAINEITGIPITPELIDEILASIDIDDIVAQITANVQVSLEILEECLELTPPPPIEGATLSINKDWFVCNNNDIDCTIETPEQQISFEGPN